MANMGVALQSHQRPERVQREAAQTIAIPPSPSHGKGEQALPPPRPLRAAFLRIEVGKGPHARSLLLALPRLEFPAAG